MLVARSLLGYTVKQEIGRDKWFLITLLGLELYDSVTEVTEPAVELDLPR